MNEDIRVGDIMIFICGFPVEGTSSGELVKILERRGNDKFCFRKRSGDSDTTRSRFLMAVPEGLKLDHIFHRDYRDE